MLLKYSLYYFVARGIPAAVSFLAVVLYTRLLSPAEYGWYALVVAVVGLGNAALFQWLRLGLLRFLPVYQSNPTALLSTLALAFGVLAVATGVVGGIVLMAWSNALARTLLALGIILLWAQAWFELNLELARSQLKPRQYGLLAVTKSVLALLVGLVLAYLGWGAAGVLLGLLFGFLVPWLSIFRLSWRGVGLDQADSKLLHRLLRYGLPLTAAFILDFVVNGSDRLLLVWLVDSAASGLYAVGYDLAKKSLWILMMIVNLAAYPLVVRALEQQGPEAAHVHLANTAVVLLGISLPSAVGLAVLAPNLAVVLLGAEYREAAVGLIPWVSLAILLAGLKAYYFDLAFQLGQNTMGQVWVLLTAAVINLGLNLWWIPSYGFMGAAYATVVAYAAGLVLSWLLGRRFFALPFPWVELGKIVLAVGGMTLVLWQVADYNGPVVLAGQVVGGAFIYGVLILLLNVRQTRSRLVRALVRRS